MTTTAAALALAWQYHQAGDLGQAELLYRQVLAAEPQNVQALFLLGIVCHVQGRVAESTALYQQCLHINPDFADAHLNLGRSLAALGRPDEAIASYQQALRLYRGGPEAAEVLNNLGVLLLGRGQMDEAQAHWQQALSLQESAEVLNNLGFVHAARGDWEQAVAFYRRALSLRPQYPEALSNLGIAHVQRHELGEAVACFEAAVALRPDDVDARNNLGSALLSQGKPVEAGDCSRQVLRLRPDNARALNNRGVACAALHNWDEAVASFQHSLACNANDPETHRNLGNALRAQGKEAEALRCYQQVLAFRPDDTEVRLVIEALHGTSPLSRVPADYVTTLFDRQAHDFDHHLVECLGYRGPELLKAALGPAPPPRSLAVLDLGCGTGLCGVQFREWADTLSGVDLSSNMLARARERGIYDELILGDLLGPLQEAEGRFDLILAADVLVYLGDLEPLFRSVHRALRPGGRFAFTVELLEVPGYRLLPTLRFAHSRAYLQDLATRTALHEVCLNQVILRTEREQRVPALAAVFSRQQGLSGS
jgi:predicted TPR repeat methyltransferase